MPENVKKTLMRKNNKNKLFSYSGNKEWLVDYINYKLNNNSKRRLLLFKDSYANSFIQFIMKEY